MIQLELRPEIEARLVTQAEASGLDLNKYVEKLVEEHKVPPNRSLRQQEFMDRVRPLLDELHRLPRLDSRSADEIVGYDEFGLPYR